jgi:transposase
MMAKHKRYPAEFKQEAIKLVTEQGLSRNQVARDLGIHPDTLRYWLQKQAPDRNTPSELALNAIELARLRRENEHLRLERDILKKAIGIFSRMPQ